LAAAGLAIGWVAAWLLSRVMSSLLYEVDPRDPLTFATVGVLLVGGALLASAIPAWRASRVDPLNALRRER
jgi:ABC-type lipoprotein release transport system permease subunit